MPNQDANRTRVAVVLAAGKGTRMRSDKAKVLHELDGRPMIHYVIRTARALVGENVVVIVGHQADRVREVVSASHDVSFALQDRQLGTGHAVQCALPMLGAGIDTVIVLCGDVPLITPETLEKLLSGHWRERRDITVLAVELDDPTGYGRILVDPDDGFTGIVEERDASVDQKAIRLINTGIYCIRADRLKPGLAQIGRDNAQGEYYLTDIVSVGRQAGWSVGVETGDRPDDVVGINTLEELQNAEAILRGRGEKG
jgi:UDP-N-acetylglucosamine diphosphorylase/glucosamine-1-phosphate N-acetyltransferase